MASHRLTATDLQWRPQARQADFLTACGFGRVLDGGRLERPVATLIGYGGAAGGGKTDADVALAALAMICIPGVKVGLFRRQFTDLEGAESAIARGYDIIGDIRGAVYNETKHRWKLPNGSELYYCHCKAESDRYNYKSSQFDILIADEATSFTWLIIDFLLTRNRANVAWPGHATGYPFAALTTNPGDVGHGWYKSLFIDSGVPDVAHEAETPNGSRERVCFLPAKLEDNPILTDRDPDYERKLSARNPTLARAMRWGDWEAVAGLFFSLHWRSFEREGKPPHVIAPFDIPAHWPLFGSVDYGFSPRSPDEKPFVYGLYAADDLGHTYRIDELAEAHWDPIDQITAIKELEARWGRSPSYRIGCPAMFIPQTASGPTIAEQYAAAGLTVTHANTDRINGWARCLLWLRDAPDGKPFFMSFESCRHFNRQIPALPADDTRRDDVSRSADDHAAEEWRHFLMSRPTPARLPSEKVHPWSAAGVKLRRSRGKDY